MLVSFDLDERCSGYFYLIKEVTYNTYATTYFYTYLLCIIDYMLNHMFTVYLRLYFCSFFTWYQPGLISYFLVRLPLLRITLAMLYTIYRLSSTRFFFCIGKHRVCFETDDRHATPLSQFTSLLNQKRWDLTRDPPPRELCMLDGPYYVNVKHRSL
jgi:hypothetical protein